MYLEQQHDDDDIGAILIMAGGAVRPLGSHSQSVSLGTTW